MPAVGARRSTRVFVPKHHADPARVLRSGKRFALSMSKENEWSDPDLKRWWLEERKIEWKVEREETERKEIKEHKKFGTVYSRKRPRSTLSNDSWNDSKDRRRFGIVFERKVRRKEQKVTPLVASKTNEFRIAECSRIFVDKLGILDIELFDRVERSDSVILASVVDCFSSSDRYKNFLVSVMKWMMKARAELWDLVALLFCRSIGTVFAKNGVHLLPICQPENRICDGNSVSGSGFCKIYGARNFIPVLSVDFSAVPSYFKFLHALISLQFHYLPSILRSEHLVPAPENSLVAVPCLMHIYRNSEARFTASEIGDAVAIIGSRLQKHQKRRRSFKNKNTNARKRSKLDSCLSDLFNDECGDPTKTRKSPGLSLAEVRQNIDSACCNANILFTDTEKCWREDGARVTLQASSAHEWFIAVKKGDVTRFLYKPQDVARPCVVNRYTHAYMWSAGDDGWKLEFRDRWDWVVFKELHAECRDRNVLDVSSAKVIPVPGVREVSGYEDDTGSSYVRPDMYIRVVNDEVGRALESETSPYYDMDSGDEEWVSHLNPSLPGETFERIVFALEKDAYIHPDFDKEKALDLCNELGERNTLCAVYDYWLKKRKQRRQPLAMVFQCAPMRRRPFIQKPFLRKKRSFKRQRSQAERNQIECNQAWGSKPDLLLQAHKSEGAARRAAEIAINLRTRAQLLMENADLAAYKAGMALRIAEGIKLDSSLLFD